MIFETHAHYDDEKFNEDRQELIAGLPEKGITTVINVGASMRGCEASVELAKQFSHVYSAVGVHPSDIEDLSEASMTSLRELASYEKTVAIGEIGLDYYWDKEEQVQERQRYWFRRQLELAKEMALPVIIHSRDAAKDTFDILSAPEYRGIRGVIHCYSYSPEMAKEYVKLGYYIGIGGVVTFKNAKKLTETVEVLPMDRILLETDSPYMAPEPNRGTRNDSTNLIYVADKIAFIKGTNTDEVIKATRENARTLFSKGGTYGNTW